MTEYARRRHDKENYEYMSNLATRDPPLQKKGRKKREREVYSGQTGCGRLLTGQKN